MYPKLHQYCDNYANVEIDLQIYYVQSTLPPPPPKSFTGISNRYCKEARMKGSNHDNDKDSSRSLAIEVGMLPCRFFPHMHRYHTGNTLKNILDMFYKPVLFSGYRNRSILASPDRGRIPSVG